jgi:molybdopterin-binding protein
MKLSARNQILGFVKSVTLGNVMAEVVVEHWRERGGGGNHAKVG